jgi:hypothetical protein
MTKKGPFVTKHSHLRSRSARIAAGVIAILMLTAGSVAADTGPIGDKSYSQSGLSAHANATPCTETGDILTCTDVSVSAFVGKLNDGTNVTHPNQVCVSIDTWSFDLALGEPVGQPTFEHGCRLDLAKGAVSIDSKLGWASLASTSLTVEQLDCDKETGVCVVLTSRLVTIAGQWTGTGTISASKSRGSGDDGVCRYGGSFKGSGRSASFTGTLGELLVSTDDLGFLSSGRETFRSRCSEG